MRTLLADCDANLLDTVAHELAPLALDVATTKARCFDLLRPQRYDVLIACERLQDGSGLALLSEAERRWPAMRRVFAAEPRRLALLKGRLLPFKLYRMLPYPVNPARVRELLARCTVPRGT
jgi:DNA-binding NtrC family response regulator